MAAEFEAALAVAVPALLIAAGGGLFAAAVWWRLAYANSMWSVEKEEA